MLSYVVVVALFHASDPATPAVYTLSLHDALPILITVGAGDSAGTGLTETNAGLTTNGTLTVTDADLREAEPTSEPQSQPNAVSRGLRGPEGPGMPQVSPAPIAATRGDTHNPSWPL